jgi:hypothetical protein
MLTLGLGRRITHFGYILEAVCSADAAMYPWQSTLVNVAPSPERMVLAAKVEALRC